MWPLISPLQEQLLLSKHTNNFQSLLPKISMIKQMNIHLDVNIDTYPDEKFLFGLSENAFLQWY